MEKFGIFELLDTLSALAGETTEPPANGGEKSVPSVTDSAFLPPDYANGGADGNHAYASFLDRHEKTVKRIGKQGNGGTE